MDKIRKITLDQGIREVTIIIYRNHPRPHSRQYKIPKPEINTPKGARRMLRGLRLFNAQLKLDWSNPHGW